MDGWNFDRWLQSQIGKSFYEVFKIGQEAAHDVQVRRRQLRTKKSGPFYQEAQKAGDFDNRLGRFLNFMHSFSKPDGVSATDWFLYEGCLKSWIKNGEVKPEALNVFETDNKGEATSGEMEIK